jgi:hypothetical protein
LQLESKALYPSRVEGRPLLPALFSIPVNIRRIYEETHAALCNRLPILTFIGIGTIVEAVCSDKGDAGKNLEQRINHLLALRFTTPAGAAILHSLRDMRNDAAHETKSHSKHVLSTAFDVIESLLRDLYILPAEAERLPRRK